MLFSVRDVDILRLICWCQCIGYDDLQSLFTKAEIENMVQLRLIKRYAKSGAYIVTAKGLSFLRAVLPDGIPELTLSYHEYALQRRLRLSRMTLTAYHAGIDVFLNDPSNLSRTPSLFLSAISRSRGSNPWGSTRIASLAHLGEVVYALHYVCSDIGKIALTDELATFSNQTAMLRGRSRAFIFAGESYHDILTELEHEYDIDDRRLSSYGEAYREIQLPVHLLSCDNTGALQLRLMALPDYRQRLTMAALKEMFVPAPSELPDCDALFQGTPFIMAADMDLRRVDRLIRDAQRHGYEQIAIAALEGQAEAVLYERYRDTGKARVYALTDGALASIAGTASLLYTPANTQYVTEEGGVLDVSAIKVG